MWNSARGHIRKNRRLVAMQPNLNIPLFLVAPDDRRSKVLAEVNRPTFSRLDPRLAEICRYISFDALRERLGQVKDFVRYLKADFLEELSSRATWSRSRGGSMVISLSSLVPDADDLLALDVEELAGVLLTHLNSFDANSGSSAVQHLERGSFAENGRSFSYSGRTSLDQVP